MDSQFLLSTWVQTQIFMLAEETLAQAPGQITYPNCACIFLCWNTAQGSYRHRHPVSEPHRAC